MRRISVLTLIAGLTFSLAAWAEEIPLLASSLVPAASGTVNYEHDRNGNIKLHMQTKNLAAPERLTPGKTAYVVWIEPRDGQPQNAGVLKVNNDLKGSFRTTTASKAFDIKVTAEDNPAVSQPTGPEIFHGGVQTR
jgi:anti-sigma-K factor RskA